jgi:thiamine biosynthesis lipoprotein
MPAIAVARHAMATRFEIVLHGGDPGRLRAAAEEALDEVDRIEAQLSLYRPGSEISQVNQRAAAGPVRVSPGVFRLLQQAQRLSAETAGAFDITVAPLMRCWGFMGGTGQLPDPARLAEARACVGMHLVQFHEADYAIQFAQPGVMLDLGAIGKGYALERAAAILRELGVTSALLHGGTSTVCAIGAPPEGDWKIALEHPLKPESIATITLRDEALSVSAVWGKSFSTADKTYGHIIDPRTGAPTQGAVLAAVVLPSATETDALSTALLTAGSAGHSQIASLRPGMRTLILTPSPQRDSFRVETLGLAQ